MPFLIGALVSGGLGLIGSISAANKQKDASDQATAAQLEMFHEAQAALQPFVSQGYGATNALAAKLGLAGGQGSLTTPLPGFNPASVTGMPGYATSAAAADPTLAAAAATPFAAPYNPASVTAMPGWSSAAGADNQLALALGQQTYPTWDPSNLASTPGYQFTLKQGTQGIQDAASRTGGIGGGNTLKALANYTTGLADTTYNQQFQNYLAQNQQQQSQQQQAFGQGLNLANLGGQLTSSSIANWLAQAQQAQGQQSQLFSQGIDYTSTANAIYNQQYQNWLANNTQTLQSQNQQYNYLYNLANLGESAGAQTASNAMQTGSNIGSNIIGAGNAGAAGIVGATNAVGNAYSNYLTNNMLMNFMGGGGGYNPAIWSTNASLSVPY